MICFQREYFSPSSLSYFRRRWRERVRHADAARRHAQIADQARGFGDVVVDDDVARLVDGVARGVGGDEGIAVAVAADPGAERQ